MATHSMEQIGVMQGHIVLYGSRERAEGTAARDLVLRPSLTLPTDAMFLGLAHLYTESA